MFTAFVSDVYSQAHRRVALRRLDAPELPLDALATALWTRERAGHTRGGRLDGWIHRSDAGSQYTAIRHGNRRAEAGPVATIGSAGEPRLKILLPHLRDRSMELLSVS